MNSPAIPHMYPLAKSSAQSKLFHYATLDEQKKRTQCCGPRHNAIALLEYSLMNEKEPLLPKELRELLKKMFNPELYPTFGQLDYELMNHGQLILQRIIIKERTVQNHRLNMLVRALHESSGDIGNIELALFASCTHKSTADILLERFAQSPLCGSINDALRMYIDLWPEVIREEQTEQNQPPPLHRIFHIPMHHNLRSIRKSLEIGGLKTPIGWS